MKNLKRISSFILALLMLFTLNSFTFMAYAQGTGNEDNPYQITTATELQNINSNPSAHYKLMANIDLKNADFTPIGNADIGAFSGSFDGNGYTISNLNVFSGKYAGLFGCNEGTIKNVILKDIYVYGTRYIGGVVGQNTSIGLVADCTVQSGKIESDGGLNNVNAGGICGSNEGSIEGSLSNSASVSVTVSSNDGLVGGIIGYNGKSISLTASNFGKIKCSVNSSAYTGYTGGLVAYSYSPLIVADSYNKGNVTLSTNSSYYGSNVGGLVGYGYSTVTITNSYNTGNVTGSSYSDASSEHHSYVGGLLGYVYSTVTITDSYNTGNVTGSSSSSAGGLLGYVYSTVTITDSYNTGNVSSSGIAGGLVGYGVGTVTVTNSYNTGNVTSSSSDAGGLLGYGFSEVKITNSYNTGNVTGSFPSSYVGGLLGDGNSTVTITNSYNTGNVSGYSSYSSSSAYSNVGGLLGRGKSTVTITNSYNTGNVTCFHYRSRVGGLLGYGDSTVTIINSYNTGNVTGYSSSSGYDFKVGGLLGLGDSTVTITNSYILKSSKCGGNEYNSGRKRTKTQLQSADTYVGWDFNSQWEFKPEINDGYPVLKNNASLLQLNKANISMASGSSAKLTAYKNGVATSDVVWSASYGNSVVSSDGTVVANTGCSTITATDSQGNKANCNIYCFAPYSAVNCTNRTINISEGSTEDLVYISLSGGDGDFIIDFSSSNQEVATIDDDGNITPKSVGNTVITVTTAGGAVGTQNVTIVNSAKSISLPSSITLGRGATRRLTATTNPSPTSSKITWTSSDNNVATVDQNGNVTGVSIGSATITAKTDNGYSATCSITVNAPITSMEFENPSITVYKGDVQKLNIVYSPSDTTDSISYSSSSSSNLPVDSTGKITAKYTGTYKVTATASSDVKAYCTIKVIDYPVIVTGIELDQEEHDMIVGEVFKLNATVTPSNATNKAITWASTDETVASVSQAGTVEAKGAGKTLITAETENGIIAYCVVNVTGVASTNLSKIYVPNVLATEEDYVDIPVMIENNPGISFASISVLYDADKLEPISVTNGDVFGSVLGSIESSESKVKLCFTSDVDITDDGVLATIRFNVLDKNSEPQVKLCYFPSEIRNTQAVAVAFNLGDGRVGIPECSHKNTELINAKEASCTQNGYTGDLYCLDCETVIVTGKVEKAKGHSFGTNNPSCSVCGIANPNYVAPTPGPTPGPTPTPTPGPTPAPTPGTTPGSTPDPTPDPTPTPTPAPTPAPAPSNVITFNGESIKPNSSGEYVSKKEKKPSINKLSKGRKSFKVTWKKISGVSGYQVQYSTSKKFTKKTTKTITCKGNKKFTKTIKKLKGKKKYYVRVRTYKTINGKKVYSGWSKVKTVTTKK